MDPCVEVTLDLFKPSLPFEDPLTLVFFGTDQLAGIPSCRAKASCYRVFNDRFDCWCKVFVGWVFEDLSIEEIASTFEDRRLSPYLMLCARDEFMSLHQYQDIEFVCGVFLSLHLYSCLGKFFATILVYFLLHSV